EVRPVLAKFAQVFRLGPGAPRAQSHQTKDGPHDHGHPLGTMPLKRGAPRGGRAILIVVLSST
ncbi:MAG: hypothetical protein ACYC7H_09005, partial [Chloroflexota bacterium]